MGGVCWAGWDGEVGGVVWLAVADWITCIRPIRLGLLLFHLNDKWDDVGK